MNMPRKLPVRLAFREEGNFWNCYLARAGTMEGAKLIGSIAIGPVRANNVFKRIYMNLMEQILAETIEDLTGLVPEWEEQSAPEGERSGHA
jgi:hypothetical protein